MIIGVLRFVEAGNGCGAQKELAYRLLHIEQDRSESLLLNVLPREIAARLKSGERTIADQHPAVSVLFKIRTIKDGYMVASDPPRSRGRHSEYRQPDGKPRNAGEDPDHPGDL